MNIYVFILNTHRKEEDIEGMASDYVVGVVLSLRDLFDV